MENKKGIMLIILVAVCMAACSVTIYTQYKPINSHQEIKSSSNTSADSAAVNIQWPR